MQSVRRIDEAWKAALIGRLDFVDVVQRAGVKLERKAAGEYVGLCPFHADSSPSFGVNPGKGVCSCWSTCGSGDVIWFWQKASGKGFLDAVRELAAMVGMAVPGEEQQAAELGRPVVLALTAEQLAEAEAKRAKRELEEGRRRAKSINQARAIWRDAAGDGRAPVVGTMPACLDGRGPNHPRLVAYFKARGVPVERLPGGELPRTLRYHGACPFETPEDEKHPRHVPAVVAAWIDDPTTKVVTGVQRIALDLAGEPRKLDTADAKRTRGSFSNGGCVPLGPRAASGLLVLCEGLETGVALQAMLGDEGTVWALVSTSGMRTFALGQQHVSDPRLGWVKQVIIAGDTDKSHAGERAAEVCAANIRKQWPELPLAIAMVGHTAMPQSIARDGRILDGKSVDWLDAVSQMGADESLLAFGAAAKAGEVAAATTPGPVEGRGPDAVGGGGAGGGGGGDDGGQGGADDDGDAVDDDGRPILPPEPTKRAKSILRRLFSPAKAEHAVWRLRRFGGKWWVYGRTGGVVRWREMDEEQLSALVRQEADRYVEFKKADYRPAALPMAKLTEIMHAATLWTSASGQAMPQWLPPAFRAGKPQWRPTLALDVDEEAMEVRAEDVVTLTNGLLDVGAWCRGELRLLPPSPRWFCATSLRYELPIKQLGEIDVACDEEVGTLAKQLAPNWHRVIGEVLSGDGPLCSTLQEWYGYCLVPDNTLQKMLWLQGAPGSGKGTLMEGFLAMVGEEATATSTIDRLGDKYTASGFVGKLAVIVPEVHTDHRTPMGAALTMIKTITGNGPVPVEDKFEKVQPNVRLTCRLMFTPNEEPRIFDSSNALERRLLVIPTGLPVVNRDPLLYGKIRSEAVGIMLWALVGLRRLRRRGDFVQPEAGMSILDEMKRQMSPVSAFVADTCVVGAKQSVRTEALYQLYHKWCEQQGQDGAATLPVFAKQLRAALPGVAKYRQQTRVMSLHGYTGLRPKLERLDGATDEPGDYHVGMVADAPPFSETDAMVLGAGEIAVLRAGGATLEARGPRTPLGAEIRPQGDEF
jgi:P4 family phage/plasmid primase-like protien